MAETGVTAGLPGEGDSKLVVMTRRRRACENCGEDAVFKNTFLLKGARTNPRSSAFGKDDCSRCSDYDVFLCEECQPKKLSFAPSDVRWCATYTAGEQYAHLFLVWAEKEIPLSPDHPEDVPALIPEMVKALKVARNQVVAFMTELGHSPEVSVENVRHIDSVLTRLDTKKEDGE